MSRLTGFPPIARADARILILGSMPGVASLAAGRYYAHSANAFWPLMAALLGFAVDRPYEERTRALLDAGIALWDVLQHCEREGSLDSAINATSEVPNDFTGFFKRHCLLQRIVFNGAKAQQCFRRHVLDPLPQGVELIRLPSTSPAHAGMRPATKLMHWRAGLQLEQGQAG